MLRRTQPIAAKIEPEQPAPTPVGVESVRRPTPVAANEAGEPAAGAMRADIERAFSPRVERAPLEQRPSLPRTETDRASTPRPTPRTQTSYQSRPRGRWPMQRSRIILLFVAMVAGGLAAYLALQDPKPAAPVVVAEPITEVVPEPKMQILVAKHALGVGERLSPTSVEWQDWPESALRPEYITVAAAPEAIEEMSGSVARFEFFPGEPIREQKLALPSQGYLSAVLATGMRGVSVAVTADSASGGFILPNDRVDVVLTRVGGAGQISDTILRNVKVRAINTRLGETGASGEPADPTDPRTEVFADQAIATLELDATQAEVIINAAITGKLSLVLRSMTDTAEQSELAEGATNQAIRISSPFWSK